MASRPFALPFDRLPATLALFPLPNGVVMPGCQMPLVVFEPRYLNLVFDVLGTERMIGMVQPDPGASDGREVPIYRTGTAGRITSFSEAQGERLFIVLTGVCRFDIEGERLTPRGYREATVDWSRFRSDHDFSGDGLAGREQLMPLLGRYFQRKGLEVNSNAVERLPVPLLVNALIGQLPFAVPERQMLVEAVAVDDRVSFLCRLLEFELAGPATIDGTRH